LNQLGANENQELSDAEKRRAHILLFGHSWGASAVIALSRKLERKGSPVTLTIQVDSVAKPFQNDRVVPPNVFEAANFYQTRGPIHGRSRITSADHPGQQSWAISTGSTRRSLHSVVIFMVCAFSYQEPSRDRIRSQSLVSSEDATSPQVT